jgi:hypothetical protein
MESQPIATSDAINRSRLRSRRPLIACSILAAIVVVSVWNWRDVAMQEKRNLLNVVPHQFAVRDVVYVEEECTGMGLSGGDDCVGVLVFELPESSARQIQETGLSYFRDLGEMSVVERWSGVLEAWQPTPVPMSREWSWSDPADAPVRPPSLGGFLGPHQFMIDIDRKIASDIDAAISAPGSYFAQDRYGVMIVMPAKRRVVYAYRN